MIKAPGESMYVMQMDIPIGVQRRPVSLLTVDLSNNNLVGEMLDETENIWSYIKNWGSGDWNATRFYNQTNFLFSYNKLTKVTAKIVWGGSYCSGANNVYFDHNRIENFDPKFVGHTAKGGGGGIGTAGAKRIRLHNNNISSIPDTYNENYGTTSNSKWLHFMHKNAEEFRIENNKLNFSELKKLKILIDGKRNCWGGGNSNAKFKFTYAPQKPFGKDSIITKNVGDVVNLNFNNLVDNSNEYIWERNGEIIPLSSSKTRTFKLTESTAGMYVCRATNSALPELTIKSKAQMLFVKKIGNNAITDFSLSNNKAPRGASAESVIGIFNAEDPDGDQIYYRLINFEGDNADFRIIDGNTLISSTILFEYSYKKEYTINVEGFDIYGGRFTKTFKIIPGEFSGAYPKAMYLSKNQVNENNVGEFSELTIEGDSTSKYNFELPDFKDNGYFSINNNKLSTKLSLNYEKKSKYNIRVKAINGEKFIMRNFTIYAKDLNDSPNAVGLTNNKIPINKPSGTFVGLVLGNDDDKDDVFIDIKIEENENFDLIGKNTIVTKRKFTPADIGLSPTNFIVSSKRQYVEKYGTSSFRIKYDRHATATVTNSIEITDEITSTPQIQINKNSILENSKGKIGTLKLTKDGVYGFELVNGANSEHNYLFEIVGNELHLKKEQNFEGNNRLNVRLKSDEFENNLVINIGNVNEAPTNIGLSNFSINQDLGFNSFIATIFAKDEDDYFLKYDLIDKEDNCYFKIKNDSLLLRLPIDKQSFNIKLKATDKEGLNITKKLNLQVPNYIDKNSRFTITNNQIEENYIGEIGIINTRDSIPSSINLTAHDSSNNNNLFEIKNNTLSIIEPVDYEKQKEYIINLTDGSVKEDIKIMVQNINESPEDICLNNFIIHKEWDKGTFIANIATVDPDGSTFKYKLGNGKDNNYFNINKNNLVLTSKPDKNQYDIEIISEDEYGLKVNKHLTLYTLDQYNKLKIDANALLTNNLIYPNPVENRTSIKLNDSFIGEVVIKVRDLKGNVITQKQFTKHSIEIVKELDLSEFSTGVYLIDINYNNNELVKKIIEKIIKL
jgi:hypothetical protein